MAAQTQISSTTQDFLEIYDITGNIVILKDGSTSMILSVNAINFGLLAEEEQDAIIYSYASLLNSLNYNIQVVISSVTKDVSSYLHQLEEKEAEAPTRLRQAQIRQYREFVSTLIQERNVLDKKFYVAIPASALEMGLLPPSTVLPGAKAPDISTIERSVILEKARNILEPKRDHLIGQFARIGLYARQLDTQEIIQNFYTSYNPESAEGQQITDSKDYTTPLVNAQIAGITAAPVQNPLVEQPRFANTQVSPAATTAAQPQVSQPLAPSAGNPASTPSSPAVAPVMPATTNHQPPAAPSTAASKPPQPAASSLAPTEPSTEPPPPPTQPAAAQQFGDSSPTQPDQKLTAATPTKVSSGPATSKPSNGNSPQPNSPQTGQKPSEPAKPSKPASSPSSQTKESPTPPGPTDQPLPQLPEI